MFKFATTAARHTTPVRNPVASPPPPSGRGSRRTSRAARAAAPAVTAEPLEGRQMFSVSPDPGDTFQTAYNVGVLRGTQSFGEHVSTSSDATDIYKFTMPEAGRFYGRVRAYDAPADVTLAREVVGADGQTQIVLLDSLVAGQSGPDAGSSSGNFAVKNLAAGNYFIVVQGLRGPTDYLVKFTSDFAGESIGQAKDIGSAADDDFREYVGDFGIPSYDDAADLFKVKMDAAGKFRADLTLDNTDPRFFAAHVDLIRDANGNGAVDAGEVIGSSPVGTFGAVERNLEAGTYFLRVGIDSGYSNYTLHVNADYAGSAANQYRNAGGLGGKTFTDYIHSAFDQIDQYRFDGASNGALNVNFYGADGSSAGLALFRDANLNGVPEANELVNSIGVGSSLSLLTRTQGGPYILRVTAVGGGGKYTLSTDNQNDPAGGTLGQAQNLGAINGLKGGINGYTSSTDRLDYYKFTVGAAGTVSAALSPSFGNADLALIRDANGNGAVDANEVLASSALGGSQVDRVSKSVSAGTYFVRVNHASAFDVSKYYLSVTTDYAGQTPATARNAGTLNGVTRTFDDWASQNYGAGSDTVDLYKFTLTSARTFKATLAGSSGEDLNLALFQDKNNDGVLSANEQVAASTKANTANEAISKSLGKGTYFVRVVGVNGDSNYRLTLSA